MAKSLDVLDRVIGEFDDGFLSESDARSISTRKESKGQFSFNDQIDRIFDDVYEDSKVERLNNFKISSTSGAKKHNHENLQSDTNNISEIPAPGTFLAARRQYLDNLDRHSNDARDTSAKGGGSDGGKVTNGIKREKFSSKEAVVPSPVAAARSCQDFQVQNDRHST